MTRLSVLLLLSFLLACPTNQPSNDDDAANDDDSTAADLCEGEEIGPIDLSSADETLDLVLTSISMVDIAPIAAETLIGFGDDTCPDWDGPEVTDVDLGTAVLTGDGCLSTTGYRYDGSAVLSWERDGGDIAITVAGEAFVMTWEGGSPGRGGTPAFSVLGVDGTFSLVEMGSVNFSKSMGVEGWFIAHFLDTFPGGDQVNTKGLFPEGFDGSWAQTHTGGPLVAETHDLSVNIDVRCRGPLTQEWDLVFEPDSACSAEPDSGTATVTSGGHTVRVDPSEDTDCDDCFLWTLDGTPQPPLCPSS